MTVPHAGALLADSRRLTVPKVLRVTLKDGRVVGGYFGDGSLAGYSEHAQDLFISERWSIDLGSDWFVEAARGTEGLWIARDEIASIEFYERPPDKTDIEGETSG